MLEGTHESYDCFFELTERIILREREQSYVFFQSCLSTQ